METLELIRTDYRQNSDKLVGQSIQELGSVWSTLDLSEGREVRNNLEVAFPALLAAYRPAAAGMAVEHYENLRYANGVTKGFRSVVANPRETEAALASVRWALSPLFGVNPSGPAAFALLSGVTQRLVLQAARDTLIRNVFEDKSKPMFARNPAGRDTCKFCIVMASRGAVYVSAKAAGRNNDYHDNCWCEPEPIWDNDALPYDPQPLYEQYKDNHDPGMTLDQVLKNWK